MTINDIIKLEIIDINHEGMGVGKYDGFTIFVPFALPKEMITCKIVRINKNFGYGDLIEIIKTSNDRIEPKCYNFNKCGGCDFLHLAYDSQLEFKLNMANQTLKRLGHIEYTITKIVGMKNPYEYRNKVQIPFGNKDGKVICGYYQKKSHEIIPLNRCVLQKDYFTDIVKLIRNLCIEYNIQSYDETTKTGNVRHVILKKNMNDEVMVIIVTNKNKFPMDIVNKLVAKYPMIKSLIQNVNREDTNIILGDSSKTLYGTDTLSEVLCELKYNISCKSFFQINLEQTEKMYRCIEEYASLNGKQNVIDGYCGVGTISLLLAKKSKYVYGIEVVDEAVINAKENAKINNITNVDFFVGRVEDQIEELINKKIDLIVIDPPRKGLDIKVIEVIKKSKIHDVIYVSCNIATLARDLSLLQEQYEIEDITLFDLFCHTTGVETVCKLKLK